MDLKILSAVCLVILLIFFYNYKEAIGNSPWDPREETTCGDNECPTSYDESEEDD